MYHRIYLFVDPVLGPDNYIKYYMKYYTNIFLYSSKGEGRLRVYEK